MYSVIFYAMIISAVSIFNCEAMQHKWRKPKGSFANAQPHRSSSQHAPSNKEILKLKKLAAEHQRIEPITAQDQITALISLVLINQTTRHPNRK